MLLRALVGQNLRRIRLQKGLSQEELAATSGVSQQYLSGLENGLRNPTLELLHRIADALKSPPESLLANPQGRRLTKPSRRG
jgi:transcriptional regulator with XRE-family HTH domain